MFYLGDLEVEELEEKIMDCKVNIYTIEEKIKNQEIIKLKETLLLRELETTIRNKNIKLK